MCADADGEAVISLLQVTPLRPSAPGPAPSRKRAHEEDEAASEDGSSAASRDAPLHTQAEPKMEAEGKAREAGEKEETREQKGSDSSDEEAASEGMQPGQEMPRVFESSSEEEDEEEVSVPSLLLCPNSLRTSVRKSFLLNPSLFLCRRC